MTRKFWSIAVVIFLLINTVLIVLVWLDKPGKQRPRPQGPVNDFLKTELNLTPQQEEQFEMERQKHFESMRSFIEESKEKRDKLFDQIKNTDSSSVQKLSQELAAAETQKEVYTVMHFRKLRSFLNDQQKEKFDKIFKDVLHMMSGGRPDGPPPEQDMPPQNN